MRMQLSILIPTYNDVCIGMVRTLASQASQIKGLSYEIIVADDASTELDAINKNHPISQMENCRLIRLDENIGRAAIRNFLAETARYEWLLFLDSGMGISKENFLQCYLEAEGNPIYGGYIVEVNEELLKGNLRYLYERHSKVSASATLRQKKPYNDFHTSNFLVSKRLFSRFPLDERFLHYGYEDVIWGKLLKENNVIINHIDNPIVFNTFEDNEQFVRKTEEGIQTLLAFRKELKDYSRLLFLADLLIRLHLDKPFLVIYRKNRQRWRDILCGDKPSLSVFNLYKLGEILNGR